MTEQAEEHAGVAAAQAPPVVARGLPSVLWRTVRLLCGGGVAGAALPVIACNAALQSAVVVAGVLVIGDDGIFVNGEIRPYGLTPHSVGYACAAVIALSAAHVAAVATVVLIAAGRLLDRPVTARSAAGAVARRAPALAASLPLIGGVLLAVPAAGAGTLLLTGEPRVGVFAYAVAGVVTCWSVLAVPLVVLEGAGPVRAMARAWTLTRHRRARWSWFVLAGVLLVPGAVAAGVSALALPLDDAAAAIAGRAAALTAAALVVLLQGTALAVVTLDQWYPDVNVWRERRRPLDLDAAMRRLPTTDRRTRPSVAAVLAVLAIASPALLYWTLLRTDPYDLTTVSDRVVGSQDGRNVLLLPDGSAPMVLTPHRAGGFSLLACGDQTCRTSREAGRVPLSGNRVEAAALPGGAVVVGAWQYDTRSLGEAPEKVPDTLPLLLRLVRCTPGGCPPLSSAPGAVQVAKAGSSVINGAALGITTAGSRIVAAAITPLGDGVDDRVLRIVRCARLPCGRPDVLATVRPPYISSGFDKPVAIATGRSGRPVIAVQDGLDGALTMVSCGNAGCDRPRTTRFGPRDRPSIREEQRFEAADRLTRRLHTLDPNAVEVAVPADDRPIATYRDVLTGAATLLRCRTPDCASADTTVLGPPGLAQQAPALALAPDGRPLIAVHDLANTSVTVLACRDSACAHRDKTRIAGYTGVPGPLDLAVGRDGRPRVLWADGSDDGSAGELHLTTCRRARCAGGAGR
ncbi:hypothetical protein [Actinomadura bangladeshensis]|uniref:Uncharacterized protein n=1 Tax=Actinomadura bangladeshensis TaxID=453573 RepID=A0A6L9QTR4_9ACTN|nr:hypothetical protein [Actinomadura bangladeshensis]NEA28920.1 hypothetical protein [Actinomadura bangladeshensis]